MIENKENKDANESEDFINEQNTIFDFNKLFKAMNQKFNKTVCRLKINGKKNEKQIFGTGFFCSIPSKHMKVLLTNNHLINDDFLKDQKELDFSICLKEKEENKKINLELERFKFTDSVNDFTIIEILDEDEIDDFLTFDENFIKDNNLLDKEVFALQYPREKGISISFGKILEYKPDNSLIYDIGTDKGSSGCPIISVNDLTVLGLHKAGGHKNIKNKKNIGIPLNIIIDKIPLKEYSEENIIKCQFDIKKDDVKREVKIYNKEENIMNSLKEVVISEEEIIDGTYKFKNEGKYFIKYYFKDSAEDLSEMFSNCQSLTKVNLMIFPKNNIKNISKMFDGCKSLKEVNFSLFNTENVINMSNLFRNCKDLEKINFYSFKTNNVQDMSSMFQGCTSLTNIDLSLFNTSNVGNMSSMFQGCTSLPKIDLSSFNTSNVDKMSSMFQGCTSLPKIDLSSFNTSNVVNMSSMFQGCTSLPKIDLSSFNTSNVVNMSSMFQGCTSLPKIDLSSFNTSNVVNMSSMFSSCSTAKEINLSKFNTKNVTNMSFLFKECKSLKTLDLSSFIINNVMDMSYMFSECTSLKNINLSSFTSNNNIVDMSYMFNECKSLKLINLSSFNTNKVKNISYMFNRCISLIKLDLSSFNAENYKALGLFSGCSSLKELICEDKIIKKKFETK